MNLFLIATVIAVLGTAGLLLVAQLQVGEEVKATIRLLLALGLGLVLHRLVRRFMKSNSIQKP